MGYGSVVTSHCRHKPQQARKDSRRCGRWLKNSLNAEDIELSELRYNRAESTKSTCYARNINWLKFASLYTLLYKGRTVGSLTADNVQRLLNYRYSKLATKRNVFNTILAVLKSNNYDADFLKNVKLTGDESEHHTPLTKEQIKQLFEFAAKYHNREFATLVKIMLYTGLRISDAARLEISDVDFKNMVIQKTMQKTGKTVVFPLHPALFEELKAINTDGKYFLPNLGKTNLITLGSMSYKFFQKAKIGARITAHCLRSTFATLCCEADVPIEVIQSWLGHSSQTVTRIYAQYRDMEKKREAISKIPTF